MNTPDAAAMRRAQTVANDGLDAAGRRRRDFTDPAPMPDERPRAREERLTRARIEILDAGRDLIALGKKLQADADAAIEAGVLSLRLGARTPYSEIAQLVGLSSQGAHKRYRYVEKEASAQRTIEDELREAEALRKAHA